MHGGVSIGNLIALDCLLEQLVWLRVGVLNSSDGLDRKLVIGVLNAIERRIWSTNTIAIVARK